MHRTNDFRTNLLDAKLLESLLPHLVRSLGDPAQELRAADDAPLVLQTASRSARTSGSIAGIFSTVAIVDVSDKIERPFILIGRS